MSGAPIQRLASVALDDASIGRGNPDQEHERSIAIYDLLEENSFGLPGHAGGPYGLTLAMHESRLALAVRAEGGAEIVTHVLSLTAFRGILKDYFIVCENYYAAIRTASPAQIEAIDQERKGFHDTGAKLLAERLEGKIDLDFNTARRLFTLVTALHWKG